MKVAFFDIDNTLVRGQTGIFSGIYMVRTGRLKKRQLLSLTLYFVLRYRSGKLDYAQLIQATSKFFQGAPLADAEAFGEEVFTLYVQSRLYADALHCIQWHKRKAHAVVLLSSTPTFLAQPIADALEIPYLIANRPVVQSARLTGNIVKPYCYGKGKLHYAKEFLQAHKGTLQDAFFYTDSISDLPLLEKVGTPICVNPDYLLKKAAQTRGWLTLQFR